MSLTEILIIFLIVALAPPPPLSLPKEDEEILTFEYKKVSSDREKLGFLTRFSSQLIHCCSVARPSVKTWRPY